MNTPKVKDFDNQTFTEQEILPNNTLKYTNHWFLLQELRLEEFNFLEVQSPSFNTHLLKSLACNST